MKTFLIKIGLLAAVMTLCSNMLVASVWTVSTVPNTQKIDAKVFTSDPDDLIDPVSQNELDRLLYQAKQQLSAEIFVVALESTGNVDLKSFATELFNYKDPKDPSKNWNIGDKDKDNGLLILFVLDQKKVTIETGYGMEGVLPDAICSRIIDEKMVPLMREGQYGPGLLAGVQSILKVLSDPAAAAEIYADPAVRFKAQWEQKKAMLYNLLIGYLILTLLTLILSIRNAAKRVKSVSGMEPYESYKVLNTSMTGFRILAFLFPLTMVFFLMYYKKKINSYRKQPRSCPQCGKSLVLMSEKQEDAYLSAGQQSEEMVGSVDYDAWICMDCGHRTFLSYAKSFTRYQPCPKCRYKTYAQTSDRIVSAPTPISAGQGVHVFTCANCGHEALKYYTIPMIIVLPSSRGGGGGGFGGGGGGFGGGSSGGGGATGGW
ncbi:MAG TPA: TPM domain-containing protein [Bacteroidales bacterium]|nr:TPM domain-containing protein [Bacteroidales bacterium]